MRYNREGKKEVKVVNEMFNNWQEKGLYINLISLAQWREYHRHSYCLKIIDKIFSRMLAKDFSDVTLKKNFEM